MAEWLKSNAMRFGTIAPADDGYHGKPQDTHFSVSETCWFELLIPQQGIIGQIYVWMRPNLGVCHAGVWIHRGIKGHPMLMEHFDYRMALPMPIMEGTKMAVPELGLCVDIVKPLEVAEVVYEPTDSKTRLQFRAEAMMPAVMRANNKHFEQYMNVRGKLVLDGESYDIDHPAPRDRSWGEKRPENPFMLPAASWCSGAFDNGRMAFNLNGSDDPAAGAAWSRAYGLTSESAFRDGWFFRDGVLKKVVSMSMRTDRDPKDKMHPRSIAAEFCDEDGVVHSLKGTPLSGSDLQLWPNMHMWVGVMAWELDRHTGYGDSQDYCWKDFCTRFWK